MSIQGSTPMLTDKEKRDMQHNFRSAFYACVAMLTVGILVLAGNSLFNDSEVGLLMLAGGFLTIIGAIAGPMLFGAYQDSKKVVANKGTSNEN